MEELKKQKVVQHTPEACCARYRWWEQSSGKLSLSLLGLWRGLSKRCSNSLSSSLACVSAAQVFSPWGLSFCVLLCLTFYVSLTLSFWHPNCWKCWSHNKVCVCRCRGAGEGGRVYVSMFSNPHRVELSCWWKVAAFFLCCCLSHAVLLVPSLLGNEI